MTALNRCLLMCVCILNILLVNGQNSCLDKKVSFPAGPVLLKSALKSISTQTGCIFSYDPTKITDTQPVSFPTKSTQSLRTILTLILPKNIQFTVNGKYIVLQQGVGRKKPDTPIKPAKNIHSNLYKGTIDDNPNSQRLVLPPLAGITETKAPVQNAVFEIKPGSDSLMEKAPLQPSPSILSAVLKKDTLLLLANDSKRNKVDTTVTTVKPVVQKATTGFGNFLNTNGYLETGISLNKQLGALTVHAGLYNIYGILSMGSDYHDSYLFGIGVGANVKLDTHFSLNFDLLQNSLIAGKSYLLNVRASNTQMSPVLNYTMFKSFKLFAGPTLNLIKSSYESGISSTDLGVLVGIGFSAGLKIDLKNLLSKHS